MILYGLQPYDPNVGLINESANVDSSLFEGVNTEVDLRVERAYLTNDPTRNYRPSLRLDGEVRRVIPQNVELGYGIDSIMYPPGQGLRMSAFYEFSNEQLSQLVKKGLFTDSFKEPEILMNEDYEGMPATADITLIHPGTPDNVPVAVVQVRNVDNLVFTEYNCGYDLAEYFQDHSAGETVVSAEKQARSQYQPESAESNLAMDVLAGINWQNVTRNAEMDEYQAATDPEHVHPDNKTVFDVIVEHVAAVKEAGESELATEDEETRRLREIYDRVIARAKAEGVRVYPAKVPETAEPDAADEQPTTDSEQVESTESERVLGAEATESNRQRQEQAQGHSEQAQHEEAVSREQHAGPEVSEDAETEAGADAGDSDEQTEAKAKAESNLLDEMWYERTEGTADSQSSAEPEHSGSSDDAQRAARAKEAQRVKASREAGAREQKQVSAAEVATLSPAEQARRAQRQGGAGNRSDQRGEQRAKSSGQRGEDQPGL